MTIVASLAFAAGVVALSRVGLGNAGPMLFFGVLLVFILWVTVLAIFLSHGCRSLRVENGNILFTTFGVVLYSRAVSDLMRVSVERHFFPGVFVFHDGVTRRVSGIALGSSPDLKEALLAQNSSLEWRDLENAR